MMEVPARFAEIPTDADLVVVCKVGARSAQVVAYLRAQGVQARNLSGGMLEWASAGRPVVGQDGRPGFVL